jgi:hypothetical protein
VTQGIRRDRPDDSFPEPGEYGKGRDGHWQCCPPEQTPDEYGFYLTGNLSKHEVTEHPDGTITVSPSILIGKYTPGKQWHGYLERGIWREV